MGDYDFGSIGSVFIGIGLLIALALWGGWELVDYFFIDDAIRSTTIITPEIELVVDDNVVDTIYVYKKP